MTAKNKIIFPVTTATCIQVNWSPRNKPRTKLKTKEASANNLSKQYLTLEKKKALLDAQIDVLEKENTVLDKQITRLEKLLL